MLMFDSLNRHYLPCYGAQGIHAPNFQRLAERTLTFDTSYVCSMPCMPARRDFHTGRPNFLHREWGPLEPFDDSVPQLLKEAGIYSHLITDHFHYFEDGGANYHNRYSSWEFFRGQEGDSWNPQIQKEFFPGKKWGRQAAEGDVIAQQDAKNRKRIENLDQFPQAQTIESGLDFLELNRDEDHWFLQIETFDPHEPFFSHESFRKLYQSQRIGEEVLFDWPVYRGVEEPPEAVRHLRAEYAATLSMCDHHLGRILDAMDHYQLWEDTLLIVWTDHGFLLGEHASWGKNWCPFYEEVAHTPFFVWDPRVGKAGERRCSLVQPSLDLGPTLLQFFGLEPTSDMLGKDLYPVLGGDQKIREGGIFGLFGNQLNYTDGRYVYMRGIEHGSTRELYDYTLVSQYIRHRIPVENLQSLNELAQPFSFTKGCPTMKIPKRPGLPGRIRNDMDLTTYLYDVKEDPQQQQPLQEPELENTLLEQLSRHITEADAPPEVFRRYGLESVA